MENCRKNCGNFLKGIEFRPMKAGGVSPAGGFSLRSHFSAAGRYTAAQRSHRVAGIAALYCGFWQRRRFLSMCGTRNPGYRCRMVQIFAGIRQCGGYAGAGSFPFAVLSRKGHRHSSFREVFGRNQTKEPAGNFTFCTERKSCS